MINLTFRSTIEVPELPPAPNIGSVQIPRESFVGFRYVPEEPQHLAAGELEVSLEPADFGVFKTTGLKGENMRIEPVGFTTCLIVKNNGGHIMNLDKSILQFEDETGNEYRIDQTGWQGQTLNFIDSLCGEYKEAAKKLAQQYETSVTGEPLRDLQSRAAEATTQNDSRSRQYCDFIWTRYEPQFHAYEAKVYSYNRRNFLWHRQDRTPVYWQSPYVITIDDAISPQHYTQTKRYDCARANEEISQSVKAYQEKAKQQSQDAKAVLLNQIDKKQAEWRNIITAAPLLATKVVRTNGQFDAVIIPPGKHRTLFMPGIQGIETWPTRLFLKLYDVPEKADEAGDVVRRTNLSFSLRKESVQVFNKQD